MMGFICLLGTIRIRVFVTPLGYIYVEGNGLLHNQRTAHAGAGSICVASRVQACE